MVERYVSHGFTEVERTHRNLIITVWWVLQIMLPDFVDRAPVACEAKRLQPGPTL